MNPVLCFTFGGDMYFIRVLRLLNVQSVSLCFFLHFPFLKEQVYKIEVDFPELLLSYYLYPL